MSRYIFILSAFAVFALAGCDTEKIAKLDNSVDAKINALIDGYVDELISSEYGWMASIKTSEGYYRYWMKFGEKNVVEMYTDNIHHPNFIKEKDITTYSFMAFQRPTLVFDNYCYVSIPNDPDDDISRGDRHQGLETDFEFEVVRYDTENEVFHLQGRFNKGGAILRKATKDDMEQAANGRMMEVVNSTYQNTDWANQYIYGTTPAGTEVAVKLYDERNMYVFAYDGRTGLQKDEFSYYNTEIDGTNNLSFPEPIDLGGEKITGVRSSNSVFAEFTTESGDIVPLSIETAPPGVPLEDLFGTLNEQDKMYNSFTTTGDVLSALATGKTYDALNLMSKFFIFNGSFNIVSRYDQIYYISQDPNNPQDGVYYLYMTMTPIGIGIDIGNATSITSFPTSTYRFELRNIDWNTLTFTTGKANKELNAGAIEYYAGGVTTAIIDGLEEKTLRLQWSNVGVSNGMVVELKDVSLGSEATHSLKFIPVAILTVR
jgi:hypothetical protein